MSINSISNFSTAQFVGIINCTPDSFYSPSRVKTILEARQKVEYFIKNGVKIIDIGGFSTRPGFENISPKEEIDRVIPIIKEINKAYPELIISIDSFRYEVVAEALNNGANWINDISGGSADERILQLAKSNEITFICMHGFTSLSNDASRASTNDIIEDILIFFAAQKNKLSNIGIKNLIFDPGIGFNKTVKQNIQIIKNIKKITQSFNPLLIGISRKSFMYKSVNKAPAEITQLNSALHFWLMTQNVNLLRVHDPDPDIINFYKKFSFN